MTPKQKELSEMHPDAFGAGAQFATEAAVTHLRLAHAAGSPLMALTAIQLGIPVAARFSRYADNATEAGHHRDFWAAVDSLGLAPDVTGESQTERATRLADAIKARRSAPGVPSGDFGDQVVAVLEGERQGASPDLGDQVAALRNQRRDGDFGDRVVAALEAEIEAQG